MADPSQDKDFLALNSADQHAYMSDTDPDYKTLSPGDQQAYLSHVTGKPVGEFAANAVPRPQVNMKMSPWAGDPRGMPGVSEGAGLAEGLSEYDKSVAQGIGGGIKDIAQGNVSRGAHEVIGGVGSAMTPILPLTAPAAPIGALGALAGGYGGGKLAQYGAEKAGATPDQAALAGDVGNIAGGLAGGGLAHFGERNLPEPRFARARTSFKEVASAANPATVDTAISGNTALEIQKMAESGGTQPKVIRDFVKRVTDPQKGPLTYEEARKFYTNASRLSADESQRLTPDMKRMVGQFRADLDSAISQTASGAGKGPQYTQAMRDYRGASKTAGHLENLKEYGKKAAIAGTLGGGGYGLYKAMTK